MSVRPPICVSQSGDVGMARSGSDDVVADCWRREGISGIDEKRTRG